MFKYTSSIEHYVILLFPTGFRHLLENLSHFFTSAIPMEYRDRLRVSQATQSTDCNTAVVLRMKLGVIQLGCTKPLSNERKFPISMLSCNENNYETQKELTSMKTNHWKFKLTSKVSQLVSNRKYRIDATAWVKFYLD